MFTQFELKVISAALNEHYNRNEKYNYDYALSIDHIADKVKAMITSPQVPHDLNVEDFIPESEQSD